MSLLYMSIICLAVCVDSISAEDHITVSVDTTVLLPCNLNNTFTETPHIKWKNKAGVVFERSSDGTHTGSGYEGRVDVPEDELRKGNCSLVLGKVTITDDDIYRSYMMEQMGPSSKSHPISSVTLSVIHQTVSAQMGSTVVLPCDCRHLSIQTPHIKWNTDTEIVFERKDSESFPGEGYEGRVDVPEDQLLKGNCSLVIKNLTVTDTDVYRCSMLLTNTKRRVLVQKIKVSVAEKSQKEEPSSRLNSCSAGIHGSLLLIASLLLGLIFHH